MCLAFLPSSRNCTCKFPKTHKERPIIGGASPLWQTNSLFREYRLVGIVARNINRAGSITGDVVERRVAQAKRIMQRNACFTLSHNSVHKCNLLSNAIKNCFYIIL